MLLISEIVIIRQVEEPIRYRPPQANLVTIRAKNNALTLFNKKTTDYEKITLNLQPSNSSTPLVSVRKMMIVKLPKR